MMLNTPFEIGEKLCMELDAFMCAAPRNEGWLALERALIDWFETIDESLAFAGMLLVLENSQRSQCHLPAGELLLRRKVRLQVPAAELIARIG